jgi:hypothetical protein
MVNMGFLKISYLKIRFIIIIYNHFSFQKDYFGVITVGQDYRKSLTINNHGINPIGIELGNTWDQVGRYNKYAVSH